MQPNKNKLFTIVVTALVTFCLTVSLFTVTGRLSLTKGAGGAQKYAKLSAIESMIKGKYIHEYDESALLDASAKGMVASLGDPYSEYYSPKEAAELLTSIEGDYEGIGVVVYVDPEDNLLTVLAPYEDTPAQRAGMLPGDKILQIDDLAVTGENYTQAVDYMKGLTEGSKGHETMEITLSRGGAEPFSVSVTREKIVLKTVSYKEYGSTGYIRLSGFDEHTLEQFSQAFNAIDREKMTGLVLDLRDNPGGTMDSAIAIADMLVPEGLIIYVQDKNGARKNYNADQNYDGIPLAVLVNENSASAAEILAGALKDRERATLIGTKTFGKGVAQTIEFFKADNSAVKLTTQKYYIPSGVCIDGVGIEPNITVEMPQKEGVYYGYQYDFADDLQLQKALEVLKD